MFTYKTVGIINALLTYIGDNQMKER